VYLADVEIPAESLDDWQKDTSQIELFRESRWFTRGWTLQELIAPRHLYFYSASWQRLGMRSDLLGLLEDITLIDRSTLAHGNVKQISVARRIHWVSGRQTSREEDLAYCMLGIFDVNMTLIYGEGMEKAFNRLQEQILRNSDDQSLFAWSKGNQESLLATDPTCFIDCGNIEARQMHRLSRNLPISTLGGLAMRFIFATKRDWNEDPAYYSEDRSVDGILVLACETGPFPGFYPAFEILYRPYRNEALFGRQLKISFSSPEKDWDFDGPMPAGRWLDNSRHVHRMSDTGDGK
jgi:hypothetical protein